MCIIIDTNCLNEVFDTSNKHHNEFKPVFNWVYLGKGKIVYGGSKYLSEIGKYLTLFLNLNKAGKAIYVDNNKVDVEEVVVSTIIQDPDFDDQHLVALLRVSGCKLICSRDKRAYPFFRHKRFFSSANTKPKIYSSSKNKGLLKDKNIAEICKPANKTTKQQKNIIGRFE